MIFNPGIKIIISLKFVNVRPYIYLRGICYHLFYGQGDRIHDFFLLSPIQFILYITILITSLNIF